MNVLEGTVTEFRRKGFLLDVRLQSNGVRLRCLSAQAVQGIVVGASVCVAFKPQDVSIVPSVPEPSGQMNCLSAYVREVRNESGNCRVRLFSDSGDFIAYLSYRAAARLRLRVGQRVSAMIRAIDMYIQEQSWADI